MKKLLVATSALVAAGSAAALEVSLGGSVSAAVSYAGGAWSGPVMDSSDVEWSISGASNGWTYGASMGVDGSAASISVGTAGLGSITMSTNSVEWSGMNIAGFDVTATLNPADLEDASFGLVGSLGGLSIDATVNNDATRTFSADIGTAVAGASVGVSMSGNLADTSDVAYGVEVGMSAMGLDLGISMDEAGAIGVSAGMGALTVEASATGGDLFGAFTATYGADLADGLAVEAVLGLDGASTSLGVTTTLSF